MGQKPIAALLREPLKSRLAEPGKILPDDNRRGFRWIEDHLRVAIVPFDSRDTLVCLEQAVLDTLVPPFKVDGGSPPSDLCRRLAELRRVIAQ